MKTIDIPIRYYRDHPDAYDYGYENLPLSFEQSAFLLVDVDGKTPNATTQNFIGPPPPAMPRCTSPMCTTTCA